MRDKIFIDSNIILYCFMKGVKDKSYIAETLITESNCVISSQVVGEVCNNLRRKSGYIPAELEKVIKGLYSQFEVVQVDSHTFLKSMEILTKYSISFWDSIIVSAALIADAQILYSEDLQHNLKIGSLRVENPFVN